MSDMAAKCTRVLVIGAAGQMLQVTVRLLAKHLTGHTLCLADWNEGALHALAKELGTANIETMGLDLNDSQALHAAVQGAALVIHGAGPFYRTAQLVREACLAAKVDYLDIDDDVESNQEAIALHERAKAAGVRLLVGCGASPGMTNVLALDAMSALDVVHTLEMAWCVGDEGLQEIGRAVAAHAFHLGAGDSVTIEHGQAVVRQSMARHVLFPMGGDAGNLRLYETAHPEPVQFAHSHAHVPHVVCWGGFDPAPINGVLKGVSQALKRGQLTEDKAFVFLREVAAGRHGSLTGWRYALPGVWRQWRQKEVSGAALLSLLVAQLKKVWQGQPVPCRNGLAARATGLKDNRPLTVLRQAVHADASQPVATMAQATGTAAAAFAIMALENASQPGGTWFAQMWAAPAEFFAKLQQLGLTDQVLGQEISPTK